MATPYMNLTLPTEGGDAGTWDKILNDALETVDAHNHTTGNGRPIPSAGIGINADLTIAGYRLTNVDGMSMINRGALLSTGACEFFAFGGNAYFRSAGGLNVQITNGGALNMTTAGGIAGDYTSVSAEVAFSDAADSYTFKQQVGTGVRQYARMGSADVRLYEFKAHPTVGVPTNFVGLASPALAASYTLTMPAALPASTSVALVSAAGAVTVSNTIPNALTLAALLTASGGVTCAASTDVTVSGTGRFKHGSMLRTVSPHVGQGSAYTLAAGYVQSGGANTYYLPISFDVGERVTTVDVLTYGDGVMDVTIDVCLYSAPSGATITRTVIGTASNINQAATWGTNTINVTDTTLATGEQIVIEYQPNAANLRVGPATATYDRP